MYNDVVLLSEAFWCYLKNVCVSNFLGENTLIILILHVLRAYENISEGKRIYLSYVSEGMGESCDWEMIMKYQRKNESLFNSPSTTAFAFSKTQNPGCLSYLDSLLEKFRDAGLPISS